MSVKSLFRECRENAGAGISVGIPRALLVYDFAPLLIGFLNDLNVNVVLTSKTNKEIVERSVELGYTDSCFPIKLVHGHASVLNNTDFILFPCAIRLGKKDGDENQKYACPLVQASPFIIRNVLNLENKLLIPILDFSRGDEVVIKNLENVAIKMGFSPAQGRKAALAGIESQKRFEKDRDELGSRLLDKLRKENKLGVTYYPGLICHRILELTWE